MSNDKVRDVLANRTTIDSITSLLNGPEDGMIKKMKRSLSRAVCAGILLASSVNLLGDPLNQWTWRSPLPQGRSLAGVAYGGGQFVAVGENGTIITSADGYHWANQFSGVSNYLRSVDYADGEYAAVGDDGLILISSNAVAWSAVPPISGNNLRGIAGNSNWRANGLGQFLAVGASGTAIKCTNGTNWSTVVSGTTNDLNSVALAPFFFIAVGNGGTELLFAKTSVFAGEPGTTNNIYSVTTDWWGHVVACGDLTTPNPIYYQDCINEILYSANSGFIWTNQQWSTSTSGNGTLWQYSQFFVLYGAAYGSNGFVAVGTTGYTLEYNHPGVVLTSADGANWAELSNTTSESDLFGCAYGNGLYVLVGDAGSIVVSSNLINWTDINACHRSGIWAVAASDNLFIASAQRLSREYEHFADFTTLVSTNGANWSISTTNLPALVDLSSGRGLFAGVSQNYIYTTADGYNWLSGGVFLNGPAFHGVRCLNDKFVAVGDNGIIYVSTDGTNWNNKSVTTSGSFSGLGFGNGVYIASGTASATSTDGVAWSLCPTNPPAAITRIAFGKGLFVAAANLGGLSNPGSGLYNPGSGRILTSQDGTNWNIQFTAPSGSFSGIAYNAGTFLATSPLGATFVSSDGTNWIKNAFDLPSVDGGNFGYYYGVEYMGYSTVASSRDTFLAAGLDGILMQSGSLWNPATLSPSVSGSNGFQFSYNQQIDVPYRIQASTNLLDWQTVYSGIGTGQITNFVPSSGTNNPAEYFRIVSP